MEEPLGIDSFVLGIGHESHKIRLQTITNFNQKIANNLHLDNTELIINNFPKSTIAIMGSQLNGQEINQAWSYFIEDYYPYISLLLAQNVNLKQWLVEINQYQNFLKLIEGEFSIGIATNRKPISKDPTTNLDAGVILKISDRSKAKTALKQLQNKKLGIPSYSPNLNLNFSSIWLEDNNLLLAWEQNKDNSIFNQPGNSLKNNKKFISFFQELPAKNIGYFYLDVATINSNISSIDAPESSSITANLLKSLVNIGSISTVNHKKKNLETNILIEFK